MRDATTTLPLLSTALAYLAARRSVVPLPAGRKSPPLVEWKPYQSRRPTAAELTQWWTTWPTAGIAIVCGRVSGLVVLDVDPRNGGDVTLTTLPRWPRGPQAISGGGGPHFYFDPGETVVPKVKGLLPGIDLLGEGGYVVAPPTRHPDGPRYTWAPGQALGELPLPHVPPFVRRRLALRRASAPQIREPVSRTAHESLGLPAVLARLDGVRRVRRGYLARCPAHDDQHPSLSIALGRTGGVLLHCFAGCAFVDVLAALTTKEVAR
jgi:hypothetical protein